MRIQTTIPQLATKDKQGNDVKKALTLAMLDEQYPHEAWIRLYTDGSATDAIKNGGACIFIQYLSGERQAEAIPTGFHCTSYRAEEEVLVHAANIMGELFGKLVCHF